MVFHWLRLIAFNYTSGYVLAALFSHAARGPPGLPQLRAQDESARTAAVNNYAARNKARHTGKQDSLLLDTIDVCRTYDLTSALFLLAVIAAGGWCACAGAVTAAVLEDPYDGASRYDRASKSFRSLIKYD